MTTETLTRLETWTVTLRKQRWQTKPMPQRGGKWVTEETVLGTALTKSQADAIMARHPDRLYCSATPEVINRRVICEKKMPVSGENFRQIVECSDEFYCEKILPLSDGRGVIKVENI